MNFELKTIAIKTQELFQEIIEKEEQLDLSDISTEDLMMFIETIKQIIIYLKSLPNLSILTCKQN